MTIFDEAELHLDTVKNMANCYRPGTKTMEYANNLANICKALLEAREVIKFYSSFNLLFFKEDYSKEEIGAKAKDFLNKWEQSE